MVQPSRFVRTTAASPKTSRQFKVATLWVLAILAAMAEPAWAQRPPANEQRYEDFTTFRNRTTFIVDPFVWGYSREFAELFRMPEKWVEPELKGALAVAFRMNTIGHLSCGYNGREDNCWAPLNCQIDFYYDNKVKLPWSTNIERDVLMRGVSSSDYLVQRDPRVTRRYFPADTKAGQGVMGPWSFDWSIPPTTRGANASIVYFDKTYQPSLGFIGFHGICPNVVSTAYLKFYDPETSRKLSRQEIQISAALPIHVIEIPGSFMRRANTAYVRNNKPNEMRSMELLEELKGNRAPQR